MGSGRIFAARDNIIRAEFQVKCNPAAFVIKNQTVKLVGLVYVS